MKSCLLILIISLFLTGCSSNLPSDAIPAFAEQKNIDEYQIRGIDVSRYQGNIDWEKVAKQKIDFSYVKCTQKDSYRDPLYSENIKMANKFGITTGSYHYFTFEHSPESQAKNFIENSVHKMGELPPAIDIELEPNNDILNLDKNNIIANIKTMLDIIEKKYKIIPVIYTNGYTFETLIKQGFEKYPIWFANHSSNSSVPDGRQWTFWQYSKTGTIINSDGSYKDVDLNVFYGNSEQFKKILS